MTLQSSSVNQGIDAYLPRGVDHLGFIEAKLRDLRGFATLAYELIQNADDAKANATVISFNICDDALIVDNDGKFSDCGHIEKHLCPWKSDHTVRHSCDFHRFRTVASRDKREEEGTTGAFGIGFIAVYQITDHPELISGGRHWFLHDENSEDKRIQVCPGCEQCQRADLPGTRFILPWATDPNSPLRVALRIEPVTPKDLITLIEELESKLPVAMIFLKNIDRIEIRENGTLRKYFERILEGNQVLITDGKNDVVWNLIKGDFKTSAQNLRERHPGRIEEKRSYEVQLALPEKPATSGRFCVYLPTEHDTGLPFHINADFFSSSDRKKIILGSDYQSQWNYAAIEGAAETLAEAFENLPGLLGHENLWEILTSIFKVWQEGKDGKRHTILGKLWETLSPVLKKTSIVYTERKQWVTPMSTLLLGDKEEEKALSIFDALDLEIAHREIRSYIFQLPWSEVLGIERLDLDHLVHALQAKGITERTELSDLPEMLRNQEGLRLFHQEIVRLLKRQRSLEKKREVIKNLVTCAIAPGRDGALWPCNQIFRANDKTIFLFTRIDPTIPFLSDMGEEMEEIAILCPEFSAEVAIDYLKEYLSEQTTNASINNRIDPKELLDWFELRREEILISDEIKQALAELPIFPGPDGLYPLSELALPGGFEDPIGITEIIDLKRLGGKREFLQELGAEPLSLEIYAKEHIPRAFADPDLPSEKKQNTVRLLANELGKITGDKEIQEALAALPIIECEDHEFREPEDVYFPEDIVKVVLGLEVHTALIPVENKAAICEFYEWLGVSKMPRASDIFDHVRLLTSSPPKPDLINAIITVLQHIGETYRREGELSEEFEPLQSLPWLPAKGIRDQWFQPQDLYTVFRDYLFESQANFLDAPRNIQSNVTDFLKWLGVNTEPAPSLVVKHILYYSKENRPVNREVYSYLNDKTDDPAINQLKGKACLLLPNNQYVTADHVFWGEQPFGRFRYQLSSDMRKYNDLLEKLGVRERPQSQDALDVLRELSNEYGNVNKTLENDAYAVCITCWRLLTDGLEAEEIREEDVHDLSAEKVVPDVRQMLNPPQMVFFEDRAGISSKFGDFLKNNVIPRQQVVWKAMAVAGVRTLSTAVETIMLECTDPLEDEPLTSRLRDRQSQLARVLEPLRETVNLETGFTLLTELKCFHAQELKIQFSLRAFNREVESSPETVPAFCHRDEKALYFVRKNGNLPFALIARELALAIAPDVEPGQMASGLKEVLSAESDEEAKTVLDELGFAPLGTETVDEAITEGPIEDFGGSLPLEGTEAGPTRDDGEDEGATEGPITPDDALKGIFGESGVPPTETTQPPGEAEGRSEGIGGVSGPAAEKQKGAGTRKKRGKFRTYVYPEGSIYEGEPDAGVSEHRSAVDQAGIEHVVEFEKTRSRYTVVMPPKHPGYDIESKDRAGKIIRYIEVKSLSGDWGLDGAALTKPQFDKAKELGDKCWLYVVERAQQEDYKIHPIQNPAQRVNQFIYDDGWKNLTSEGIKSSHE